MTPNRLVLVIAVFAGFLQVASSSIVRGQAATAPLAWPPTLDTQNTTTVSVDGRKIERFVHGGKPDWGYPANAAWPYPPLEKFESTMQNNNCFYLVSPKVPRDNAPLCVVLHSANRSGYDYMHYSSLTPGMSAANPSHAITDSPDDFYALYLNSTNDEWWGWHQAQAGADFAKHVNSPSPAERRMLDRTIPAGKPVSFDDLVLPWCSTWVPRARPTPQVVAPIATSPCQAFDACRSCQRARPTLPARTRLRCELWHKNDPIASETYALREDVIVSFAAF